MEPDATMEWYQRLAPEERFDFNRFRHLALAERFTPGEIREAWDAHHSTLPAMNQLRDRRAGQA